MSQIMAPIDAIMREPPNVWLTSFYGFNSGNWGFLGFSTDSQRRSFIRRSEPGALVVIYAVGHAPSDMLGRVVGVLQCSHRVNHAQAFMSPMAWEAKKNDPDREDRWDLGVKAIRAWRVAADVRPLITDFANETYSTGRAQTIGSQGMPLTSDEARKLLDLDLQEVSVFGEIPIEDARLAKGSDLFGFNKAGPVSQNPYMVREAEGPKSLYQLKLDGDMSAFLGEDAGDDIVVKVGMSGSPPTRCEDHNRALPNGAFRWCLLRSNETAGEPHFPNSRIAIEGENGMKKLLAQNCKWLGGEFFRASSDLVDEAWEVGMRDAKRWADLSN